MLRMTPAPSAPVLLLGRPHAQPLLLALATLLVFLPIILLGQFFWDDYILLVDNSLIRSGNGLLDIWLSAKNPDYFPLTSTSFWLEYRLFGNFPQAYHLTNVLLHIGASIFLLHIFRTLKIPGAFLAALLFAIHPVNVESVAWIAERKNTLCLFFATASVLFYLRPPKNKWQYPASIALFLLSLLAKTATVMLPAVLLLLAIWQHKTLRLADLLRTAPYFLLSFLMGLITLWFQYHRAIQDVLIRNDPFPSRLAIAGAAVWFYLSKALLPFNLTFQYPRWNLPAQSPVGFIPAILLAITLLALLILPTIAPVRKSPRVCLWLSAAAVSLLAYTLMLLPILGFLNIFFMRYSLVSDHWQYPAIPCILAPVAAAVAIARRRLCANTAPASRRVMNNVQGAILAFIILALMAYSASIAYTYRTPESIWTDTLHHNPDSWLAHSNLGQLYLDRAKTDDRNLPRALDHLTAVTKLQPRLALGYTNLGNALFLAHRLAEAADAYNHALELNEGSASERAAMHTNIGSLRAASNQPTEAITHFRKALQLDPSLSAAHFNLALLLSDPEQSHEELQKALADRTYIPARLYLAKQDLRAGNLQQARQILNQILSIDPHNKEAATLLNNPTTTHPQ
jgi:protein O-mannosyl-transferase